MRVRIPLRALGGKKMKEIIEKTALVALILLSPELYRGEFGSDMVWRDYSGLISVTICALFYIIPSVLAFVERE
jgi:hypothetical protein